jgi:hypothetical protein
VLVPAPSLPASGWSGQSRRSNREREASEQQGRCRPAQDARIPVAGQCRDTCCNTSLIRPSASKPLLLLPSPGRDPWPAQLPSPQCTQFSPLNRHLAPESSRGRPPMSISHLSADCQSASIAARQVEPKHCPLPNHVGFPILILQPRTHSKSTS